MRELFTIDKKNYDPNGTVGMRPSVRGIIIKDGKVAMMHSLKYDYYKLPGGGIEPGETLEETLVREVQEESGLIVKMETIREYGYVKRIEKGKIDDIFIQENFYYLCEAEECRSEQQLDDYEEFEEFTLEFVSPEQAIAVNEHSDHGEKAESQNFSGMLERENRVLKMVRKEVMVLDYTEMIGSTVECTIYRPMGINMDIERLQQIRESEMKSHTEMYANEELYKEGSWLRKPIKTVMELLPLFKDYQELNVLDMGCGVGRNCIAIAQQYKDRDCTIDCVDILDIAIEKLYTNAKEYGVESKIYGIVEPIEAYSIKKNHYDLIIAVSALEHIDSKESFVSKLEEISKGIRENGVVCLVINSNVTEYNKETGCEVPAQFEVNLPTEELQDILGNVFDKWTVLKSRVQVQQYDIPREFGMSDLKTSVVTFVARK